MSADGQNVLEHGHQCSQNPFPLPGKGRSSSLFDILFMHLVLNWLHNGMVRTDSAKKSPFGLGELFIHRPISPAHEAQP